MLPIFQHAISSPNAIAIIDNIGAYSYQTLLNDALRVANFIQQKNLYQQPILYLFPSSYQYVVVQWGIWLSNNIAVPLHTAHTKHEIDYYIEDTTANLFIYDEQLQEKINTLEQKNINAISLKNIFTTQHTTTQDNLPKLSLEDNALMIYTSGTTGKPKGVVMSHKQIDTQIRSLTQAWQWSSNDRILNVLPMHHVHGVINITCCALYNGALVELQSQFNAEYVATRMASKELTLFMAVPTVYQKLIQYFEESK
jgi:malonyl-CoA/methylmalonyl-CoA synthetase